MKMRFFLLLLCLTTCYGMDSRPQLKLFRRRNSGLFFEGETIKVTCEVSNAKKVPRLIWLLSFVRVKPDEEKNTNITTTINGTSALSTLTIQNVTFEKLNRRFILCKDLGNVKSSLNTDFLKIGKLSVSRSGGHFSTYGGDEVLTCSLSNGKAEDIDYLMWRKISPSVVLKRTSHATSVQLHFKHVNETDAGAYQCVFHSKNGYSFFMNKTVEIKVGAANAGERQKNVTYSIPESVKLTCDIRGSPLAILWRKNCNSSNFDTGEILHFRHTLQNNNRTLVINQTSPISEGAYCCVGWNEGGMAKQIFILRAEPFDKHCEENGSNHLKSLLGILLPFLLSGVQVIH